MTGRHGRLPFNDLLSICIQIHDRPFFFLFFSSIEKGVAAGNVTSFNISDYRMIIHEYFQIAIAF